jgi:hypothetical protein
MAAGLQIFDASGAVVVDLSDRPGRILGAASATTSSATYGNNGSVTDARLANGTPFYIITPFFGFFGDDFGYPIVTFSGTTMSWNYVDNGNAAFVCTIYYGTF